MSTARVNETRHKERSESPGALHVVKEARSKRIWRRAVRAPWVVIRTALDIAHANLITFWVLWDAQKRATVLRLAVGFAAVFVPVLSWYATSVVIDAFQEHGDPGHFWTGISLYVIASIALGVLPVALSSLERMSDNRTFELVFSKFTRKMVTFTQEQLSEPQLADRVKQVRERAVWRMMAMARLQPQVIRNIGSQLVALAIVGTYGVSLVGALLVAVAPTMYFEVRHARRRADLDEELAPVWGSLWGDLHHLTVAPSLAMLHQFGAALWFAARYRRRLGAASLRECELEIHAACTRFVAALCVGIGTTWCLWVLGADVLEGRMSVGEFVLVIGAVSSIAVGSAEFAALAGQEWSQAKSIADLRSFLDHAYSPRVSMRAQPLTIEYGKSACSDCVHDGRRNGSPAQLEFRDVWYQYPGALEGTFAARGLSFVVPCGSVVAVVGPNGAGKSSMMALLSRQLKAQRGIVMINGTSIDGMDEGEFAKQVVMLPQRLQHYNLTVRELLNLGRATEPASAELLWQELDRVGAAGFVRGWKHGLDTELGLDRREATEPSGGQLQRLLLAAVVLANRGLVVLDEPVSMVDPESAKRFWDAMFAEVTGRTLIFSTHHLGAVRRADRILYIEDGRVAVQGKHDELMERAVQYRNLFEAQAGEYR